MPAAIVVPFTRRKMSRRKQLTLDVKTKIRLIEEVQRSGKSRAHIAETYGVSKSTVSTIMKNKDKFLKAMATGFVGSRVKRMRVAQHANLENALINWLVRVRGDSKFQISGQEIQDKANQLAKSLNIKDFKCSSGWLWRFQNRHGLISGSISVKPHQDPFASFMDLKAKYKPNDVFYIGECGLFYKNLPSEIAKVRNETCDSGDLSQDRLTLVFACNSDGSQKFPVWVIGTPENVASLNEIGRIRCNYSSQDQSWLDETNFGKWMTTFNKLMACKGRHVLMTLLDHSGHQYADQERLTNVKLYYFPLSSAYMQPLNQGIISKVKSLYRETLLETAILETQSESDKRQYDCLDAARAIIAAWDAVNEEFIEKCFAKAWGQRKGSRCKEVDESERARDKWNYLRSIRPSMTEVIFSITFFSKL